MPPTTHYDVIVIGSGQGGGPFTTAAARAGRKTALIEREHVGGTCINEGCTPTKTMVASGRVAYLARRGDDYGVEDGPVTVDMAKVRRRKRDIVASFRGGSERRITETPGVTLIRGQAGFTGPKSLRVELNDGGSEDLTADLIVIDTGGRPSSPPIPGLDTVPCLNSTSVMELDVVPEHLLVLGGGYVGLEFGQLFRRLGSRVTIVQQAKQLLGREDQDIADAVLTIMQEDGIEVLLETQAFQVEGSDGAVQLHVRNAAGERVLSGSHLLVAVGRKPNTEDLNLPAAGIEIDSHGLIKVDERLRTTAPDVYAIGDVAGSPPFTHISYDDYRILKTNLLEGGDRTKTNRLVPYTVFIDPQLGRVGLTEAEARQQGRTIKIARMPMSHIARTLEVDEPRGVMKAIVDADTKEILGAAILGLEGGELMAMIEIAMLGKLPYTVLRDGIFAHPTLAEGFNNLFESFE